MTALLETRRERHGEDSKYTLEAPTLSPLRRPLSADMETQFEELRLAYISPETRDSMRHSLRVSATSRFSCESARDSGSSIASRGSER